MNCRSEKYLDTAKEKEENNILKKHINYNPVTSHFKVKYLFVKNPTVLLDSGAEVKAFQVSQERG